MNLRFRSLLPWPQVIKAKRVFGEMWEELSPSKHKEDDDEDEEELR